MNFLAHAFLSEDDEQITIGNFIADHVKGKSIQLFSEQIIKGILIHRQIDFFTDNHPTVAQTKLRLRPQFHKYAPVIADVYYDHFLARNWNAYSPTGLAEFADSFYHLMLKSADLLPQRTLQMLPYMISNNWLVSYASIKGIDRVLTGMSKRTKFPSGMEHAAEELEKNYELYLEEFNEFFPELREYVKNLQVTSDQ
jgi:acyl carrier protein phosphodiesterase